jgi:flagellar assembly protein FliH
LPHGRVRRDPEGGHDSASAGRACPHLSDEDNETIQREWEEKEKKLREEFGNQLMEERRRVEALLVNIRKQFTQVHEKWERSVVQLALAIARSIIKREVSIDKEIMLSQIREALHHLVGVEKIKLRIHPRDEEIVRQSRADLFSTSDSLRDMVIEVDEKIEPGGCIVESESGNVDARPSTQLTRIEAMLFDQMRQEARS